MWRVLKESMIESAEVVCGKRGMKQGIKKTAWWNEEVSRVIREKNEACVRLSRERGARTGRYERIRRDYVEKRNVAKRVVAMSKKEWKVGESIVGVV